MSLTNDEVEELEQILARAGDGMDQLNDWERGFINDQQKRFDQYGADIRLSPKQWAALRKINEVL